MLNFNAPSSSKRSNSLFVSDVEDLLASVTSSQPRAAGFGESIARVVNTTDSFELAEFYVSSRDRGSLPIAPVPIASPLDRLSDLFGCLPSATNGKESDQASVSGDVNAVDPPDLEKNSSVTPRKTYSLEDFGIIDKLSIVETQKYIEIDHISWGGDSILINASFNFEVWEKFHAYMAFHIFYDKEKSSISFFVLTIDEKSKLPFTATDIFQVVYDHCVKKGLISEIKEVTMMGISSYENKHLANNLEKIRIDSELGYEEKIAKMEKEIFSGNHAGKSVFRRLNRIGYQPICNSLKISAEEMQQTPITAGSTKLTFDVARKNSL